MNISLNWLTDYVDVSMPAVELGELFTRIGLNCDGIETTDTDVVFDLEVTSNRPDWLGHLGVARELAAATGCEFRPPKIDKLPTAGDVAELTGVEVLDPDLCLRYTARVIRGVKVGPSPRWMVERLEAVGMRSVNNIVDVTNYVLMEYSQPLHSFDYDKLAGNRIVVRRARPGEVLTSIDETTCHLDENMLVIADAEKAVAIAGVMGGLSSEVDAATVNVLIESAWFDPLTTRHTSRRLGLMSESNYRFERGVDPVRLDEASRRACGLILDLAGGELAEGVVDVWANPYQAPTVALRPQHCEALLGMSVPADRQIEILDRLGLGPKIQDGRIVCTIPSHRADLRREVDLIEEVARLAGYDEIPVAGRITHAVEGERLPQKLRRDLGRLLTAAGFDEAMTFTFVDTEEAELFGHDQGVCVDQLVRKTNNALRSTLLPSLLRACKTNQLVGNDEVSLYELSSVFPPSADKQAGLPAEGIELAMVTTRDLREVRGTLEETLRRVVPEAALSIVESDVPGLAKGGSARVVLDGGEMGAIGNLADNVQDYYGLERPIAAATISFEALLQRAGKIPTHQALAKFPAMQRDLSIIVDEDVSWRQFEEVIASVAQPLRVATDYVTTYRGKPISDGRKSVTASLTYRSDEGTLRSEQVDEQIAKVVEALTSKLSGELRK